MKRLLIPITMLILLALACSNLPSSSPILLSLLQPGYRRSRPVRHPPAVMEFAMARKMRGTVRKIAPKVRMPPPSPTPNRQHSMKARTR